ncbi:sporulation histidine kinase inhibitor Sda (plasmid) [Alkalihalophilus pseudofirmus]|nr:sporulation histidine kinase inhibitor Sda [Alkalihalophilus pseudofirmus]WEG19178.1 sporulation histidine kinase inhibitor Sda [Alkalihalophilus pseudofirmus]
MLNYLDDDFLLDAYYKACSLNLDSNFLSLLLKELEERELYEKAERIR